jgi:hypothetical protein
MTRVLPRPQLWRQPFSTWPRCKPRIDRSDFDRAAERSLISAGPGHVNLLIQRGEDEDTAMAKGLVATSGRAPATVARWVEAGKRFAPKKAPSSATVLAVIAVDTMRLSFPCKADEADIDPESSPSSDRSELSAATSLRNRIFLVVNVEKRSG